MLQTEMRNPNTVHIDAMSTADMMQVMQNENKNAVNCLDSQLGQIAQAVDAIAERMKKGGRLFYIGCGTSGRLGVVDAAECPPTYGVSADTVVGIIAGGYDSMHTPSENTEDNAALGRQDFSAHYPTEKDSIIGISAAGGAPYVCGALEYAKEKGCFTVALNCNPGCPLDNIADLSIHTETGAEVITGSTRMKAGTAHKMVLNMISTAVMIKLGHVCENYMINLKPSNKKLRLRMMRITSDLAKVTLEEAERLLDANDWSIRKAVETRK